MDHDTLDKALLQAHENGDHTALIGLYTHAANQCEAAGDIDATCFFLTQAFVFALEQGTPVAQQLNARLVTYGRANPTQGQADA